MKDKDFLINEHQTCVEILEGIKSFELKIKLLQDDINNYGFYFIGLAVKYKQDIEILNKSIDRLKLRYNNKLIELINK